MVRMESVLEAGTAALIITTVFSLFLAFSLPVQDDMSRILLLVPFLVAAAAAAVFTSMLISEKKRSARQQ